MGKQQAEQSPRGMDAFRLLEAIVQALGEGSAIAGSVGIRQACAPES